MLEQISSFILPIFFVVILGVGFANKIKVYDTFVSGAADSLKTSVSIIAPLVGLMAAIGMFRASGALDLICFGLLEVCNFLHVPTEVLPLALMRPISGSASLAMVTDVLQQYGPDSLIGRTASVIMGSTETTFYTLAVYFGAIAAKDSRYTLKAALLADLTGMLVGCWICRLLFL